ncbi:MAG: TetR/AcrR family transcriptional regulator [Chloroflexaceae bacterium]|jgi:AcrR family transcriptional regulator|nr:TetR/AcrR family transcriptional regulator [Chloroflexaceae bacterium]
MTDIAAGKPRRERRDAAAHRQHILNVARELFARQGVDATSMHEIALAAGVGQGTLYRRFAHKGELAQALLADNTGRFEAAMHSYMDEASARPALERLATVLMRLAHFNEANGPLLGAIEDAAAGSRRTAPCHGPHYAWLRGVVVGLLEEAIAQGEARPVDVAVTADLVLAPLAIDLYLYQRRDQGFSFERVTQAVQQLVLDGLRARV